MSYVSQISLIVTRLQRPTVASVCSTWNFDAEDGNLMFLKLHDPVIRLPFKTLRGDTDRRAVTSARRRCETRGARGRCAMAANERMRISVDDVQFFDNSRPHTARSRRSQLGQL